MARPLGALHPRVERRQGSDAWRSRHRLAINGEWWEVKSLDASNEGVKPGNELDFIENNLRKAAKQFRDRGMNGDARVVFNPLYRHAACEEVMTEEIDRRMRQRRVKEALFITENGGLKRLAA